MPASTTAPTTATKHAVTPPCPHFGPCGGCQLQHLPYPEQLEAKADRLRALLAPLAPNLPEIHLHPSPPLGYRNRIRLTLREIDGQLRAGYLRTSSPDAQLPSFLPITQCPIAAPILWHTAETLLALINQNPTPWLRNPNLAPDQLELFTSADESTLQLTLFLRTQSKTLPDPHTAAFNALADTLRTHIPQLTGAGIALLPPASSTRSRRTETPRPGPAWGKPGLTYTVPQTTIASIQPAPPNPRPATYWIPRNAFFQVNRFLVPELLSLICSDHTSANRTGQLAWDLYAGIGLFARQLAAQFTHVTAVEIAEPAASALAATKLPNLQAVKFTTLEFLRSAVLQRERPDLIVLDPPRTGAGPQICNLLARIAAPTLIYVSCSPDLLPADLALLLASGYTLTKLHLLDLFPQTTHIETVAILTR